MPMRNCLLVVVTGVAVSSASAAPVTSGLEAWYMSDTGVTTTVIGGGPVVTGWADQAGAANDATGAASGLRPVQDTANVGMLSNHPVVRFEGIDSLGFTLPGAAGWSGMTIFYVASNTGAQSAYENIVASGGTGATPGIRWGFGLGTASVQGLGWAGAGSELSLGSGAFVQDSQFELMSYERTFGAATPWTMRRGAGVVHTVADSSSPIGDFAGVIGSEVFDSTSYTLSGDIAEILIYSRELSEAEWQQTYEYLDTRYFNVPEPLSALLLLGGGVGALLRRR
jgi:hypothetical protein